MKARILAAGAIALFASGAGPIGDSGMSPDVVQSLVAAEGLERVFYVEHQSPEPGVPRLIIILYAPRSISADICSAEELRMWVNPSPLGFNIEGKETTRTIALKPCDVATAGQFAFTQVRDALDDDSIRRAVQDAFDFIRSDGAPPQGVRVSFEPSDLRSYLRQLTRDSFFSIGGRSEGRIGLGFFVMGWRDLLTINLTYRDDMLDAVDVGVN
jgi:hypothetical protein